jgi:sec-independent protein translocase protein TatB
MFDVSFVELMLIGIVGLLVLGPEKLPVAARTVGGFVRRARASWMSVRTEFERELAAEELKRTMREAARDLDPTPDLREAERSIRETLAPPILDLDAPHAGDLPHVPNPAQSGDEPHAGEPAPTGDVAHASEPARSDDLPHPGENPPKRDEQA